MARVDAVHLDAYTLQTEICRCLPVVGHHRPKGPLITHDQFFARFMIYFVTLGFSERTKYLCATPLYFGGSRGTDVRYRCRRNSSAVSATL